MEKMIKQEFKFFFWVLLLCNNLLLTQEVSQTGSNESRLYESLEKKYNIKVIREGHESPVKEKKEEFSKKCPSLNDQELCRVAFSFSLENETEENIADEKTIEKILLLKNSDQRSFVLDTVFNGYITTAFGKVQALLTLSNPTTDLATIAHRQRAITLLHEDASLADALNNELNAIATVEKKSLMPFHSEKTVPQNDYGSAALDIQYVPKLKKSPMTQDLYVASAGTLKLIALATATTGNVRNGKKKLTEGNVTTAYLFFGGAVFMAGYYGYGLFKWKKSLENHSPYRDMLGEAKKHIDALNNLSVLINKNEQLLTQLPVLQPLADFNDSTKRSADLNHLISILNSHNFEGEDSFFSRKGPTIVGKDVLYEIKKELVPVLVAAGKLDMYVGLTKLYGERESKGARYCMAQFVENNAAPLIKAQNFWNPYIPADKAVTNSITFDEQSPNGIITGPNTGGKSTTMKALMLNALMAQSFGIAPAQELTLTPFSKMGCLMNAADDIAKGDSLFKSEVLNAHEILSAAQGLKDGKFGLFTLDEIFSGTSPDVGEEATRRYAKKLGDNKNALVMIATHYKNIADLKNNPASRYRNLQMHIQRNEDGSLKRTFKLKEGESSENIAFEIIKEQGLDI